MTTVLTVNYNTPEYLDRLLSSFRKFYPDVPYLVIDGSSEGYYKKIKNFPKKYNVELIHFDYNIHHGPGMVYGINHIKTDQILLVDSDMIIHGRGWLEMMESELRKDSYGIGDIQKEFYMETIIARIPVTIGSIKSRFRTGNTRQQTTGVRESKNKIWVDYLHPAFALINKDVAKQYADPIKGGAPLIEAMRQIYIAGKSESILQRAQWLTDDLWQHKMQFVQHNENHAGMGTVRATNGYHLD
jgi:glycosyltransferase involved in cell wall biosynthesis